MGQEIVYCHKCSTRLTGADFEKGKALRIQNICVCAPCSKAIIEALPERDRDRILSSQKEAEAQRLAERVLRDEPPPVHTPPSGTRHVQPRPGTTSRRPQAEERRSNTPLVLGLLGAAVVAVVLLVLALPGGRTHTSSAPPPDPGPVQRPDPAVTKTPDPPPTGRPPVTVDPMERERAAKSAHQAARDFKRTGPGDLPAHLDLYERALRESLGTSLEATVREDVGKVRGEFKSWLASELAALDGKVKPLLEKGDLKSAVELLNRERSRHGSLEWTSGLRKISDRLYESAKAAFPPLKQKALAAQARGAGNEVAAIREQVSQWGFATLLDVLDRELALVPLGTNPDVPTPPAVETGLPATKEGTAWQASFDKAAALLLARDAKAAVAELEGGLFKLTEAPVKTEAQADLEAFRLVEPVLAEAAAALTKWPRWQNLAVTFFDETGNPRAIDDPVHRVEPSGLEVRGGILVPYGEIAGASLVELARPARKPEDLRVAAVLGALEGDAAAAQRLKLPALPARYAAFAAKAAGLPREGEARALFHEAHALSRSYATQVAAAEKFGRLQKEFADTAFVRRNQASIKGRDEAPREFFFAPSDAAAGGLFRLRRHPKGEVAWTMSDDVTDKAKRAENYVDFVFSVAPEAEMKAWVYVGACCLETFTFWVQGTDMTTVDPATKISVAAEPGSGAAATAFPKAFLKQTHAAHQPAPKEATRFEWVQLPLPAKYAAGGTKTVRILSDQQGFSVVWAVVSATRKGPPTAVEGRDLEKARPAIGADLLADGAVKTGSILREFWNGIGDTKIPALTGNPEFPNRPSGKDLQPIFEGPRDFGDSYGTRMRGWVLPPLTGDYTFWLATDDDGELWLSTDESPAGKQKLITQIGACGPRDWNDGRKKTVKLQKGRLYYVEALQKEGGGGDHIAVGWTLPNGTHERPIPGNRLSPWVSGGARAGVEFASPTDGTAVAAPGSVVVTANVSGGGSFSRVELWQGSTRVADLRSGNPPTYTWNGIPMGSYPLVLRGVEKTGGGAVLSAPLVVRVGEITFYRAVNLNGPACTIDGQAWEGVDAPDFARAGTGYERPDAELRPATDADRAAMIRASIAAAEGTRVTLQGVPPGAYLVYLYTWAKAEPQAFDLAVEGKPVLTSYRHGAMGDWMRHGPFATEVSDGALDVQASKGTAHFSGLEVWRVGKPPPAPKEKAKTPLVGGQGGAEFEDAREAGTFLVGLRYNVSGRPIVKSVQPLFRKGGEASEGDLHAAPEGAMKEIVAKPGYAVGGLVAQGADRMSGFKITFMRITGPVLNPKDAYDSEWIGAREGTETRLAGDGMPVIGIHGRKGQDLDAFGLVYLK